MRLKLIGFYEPRKTAYINVPEKRDYVTERQLKDARKRAGLISGDWFRIYDDWGEENNDFYFNVINSRGDFIKILVCV